MKRQEVRSPVADSDSPISNHNSARPFNDGMTWASNLINGSQSGKSTVTPDSLLESPPGDWDLKYCYEISGIDGANVEDPAKMFSGSTVASERSEEFSDSEPGTSTEITPLIRTFNTEPPLIKNYRSPDPSPDQGEDLCCSSSTASEVLGKRTRGKAFLDTQLHGKTSRWETSSPKATDSILSAENQSPDSIPASLMRVEAQRCNTESINNTNQDLNVQATWPQPCPNVTRQHQHATTTNVPRNQPVKPEPIPDNERGQRVAPSMPIVDSQNRTHPTTKPSMPIYDDGQQTLLHATPPKIQETTLSVPQPMEYRTTRHEAPLTSMRVNQDSAMTPMAAPPCIDRQQIASTSVPVAQDNNSKVGESTFPAAQQMLYQSTQRDAHHAVGQSFRADGSQNPHRLSSLSLANRNTLDDLSPAIQHMAYQQAQQDTSTEMVIESSNQDIPATFLNPSLESKCLQPAMQTLQGTCAASVSAAQKLGIEMLPNSNGYQNAGIPAAFSCNGQGDQCVTRTIAYQGAQTTIRSGYALQNKIVIPSEQGVQNNPQQQITQVLQQETHTEAFESLTGTASANVRRHQSNLYHDPRVAQGKQIPGSQLQQSMANPNPHASMDQTVQSRMASTKAAPVANTASQPNPFSASKTVVMPSHHSTPPMMNNAQTRQIPVIAPDYVGTTPYSSAMTQFSAAQSSPGPVNQGVDPPPYKNMQTSMRMAAAAAVSNDYTTALQNAGIPTAFPCNGQGDQSVARAIAYQGAKTTTSSSYAPQNKIVIPSQLEAQKNPQQQETQVLQQQTRTEAYESPTGTVSANVRRHQSNFFHDPRVATRVVQGKQMPASQLQQSMAKPNPLASADPTVQKRMASETAAFVANTASQPNPFSACQTVAMPSQHSTPPTMNNGQTNMSFETRQAPVITPAYLDGTPCNSAMTQFSATQSSLAPVKQNVDPPPHQNVQTSMRMAAATTVSNHHTTALIRPSGSQTTSYSSCEMQVSRSHPNNQRFIQLMKPPAENMTGITAAATNACRYQLNTGNTPFGINTPGPNSQGASSTIDQGDSRIVNAATPFNENYQQNILGPESFNNVQTTPTPSGQIAATPSYQGTNPTKISIASLTGMSTATALPNDCRYQNTSASHATSHKSLESSFQNVRQNRNPLAINPGIQMKQRLAAAASNSNGSQGISTLDFSILGQGMQHATAGMMPTNSANGGWSNQPSAFPAFATQPTQSIPSSTSQRAPPAAGPNITAPVQYRSTTSTQLPPNSIPAGMRQNSVVFGLQNVESLIPQIMQHTASTANSMNPVTQMAATSPASSRHQQFLMTAPIDPVALGVNLAPRMKKEQRIRPAVFGTKTDVERRVRSFAKFPGVFSIVPTLYRYSKPMAENGFMLYREDLIKCVEESCSMMHKLPEFLNHGYQRQWHKAGCRFAKAKTA